MLVPIKTARFRVNGSDRLQSISALAESEDKIPDAMAEIQRVLRRAAQDSSGRAGRFPDSQPVRHSRRRRRRRREVMTYLLAGIAAVSLLVGGIGIMNIMLVSVTERTREIGIRKALGATRFNILLQFLIEAVVLCVLGGIIGIGLGSGRRADHEQDRRGWSTQVSSSAIVMAFVFSAFVGVAFGVWPARRAATLDPITALRYE